MNIRRAHEVTQFSAPTRLPGHRRRVRCGHGGPSYAPTGRAIGWLTTGSPRRDHGVDMAEEVDQFDREERRTDQRQISASGRPVRRATQRATGGAACLV
jgi:hypothetical protein